MLTYGKIGAIIYKNLGNIQGLYDCLCHALKRRAMDNWQGYGLIIG